MTSVEKDDISPGLTQDITGAVESADAQLSHILGAVTMATTTEPAIESVISESANVVVERMSSGSPTWTLTATATERGLTGQVCTCIYLMM